MSDPVTPEPASLVRMPNGVMDYLENGAGVVETAEAEARSAAGDPRSYERARERLERPDRPSSARHTGTPVLTRLFELLGGAEDDCRCGHPAAAHDAGIGICDDCQCNAYRKG